MDEGVFPHSFELKRAFLRQGYGFRRGRVTRKVTILSVTFPIVYPPRTDFASNSSRTNYGSPAGLLM
jgi:hypothetical protein